MGLEGALPVLLRFRRRPRRCRPRTPRREYAWAYAEFGDEVPERFDPSTRDSAVLDWNERDAPAARKRLTRWCGSC
jgi:hypothetical protein